MERTCSRLVNLKIILIGVTVIAVSGFLISYKHLHVAPTSTRGQPAHLPPIHICFCTDDTDLRALSVAIKSAIWSANSSSRHPAHRSLVVNDAKEVRAGSNLVFHVITTVELAETYDHLLHAHLPEARIVVHHKARLQERLQLLLPAQGEAPRHRNSPAMALAPFYLHEFLSGSDNEELANQRVIYFATDVVVQADVAELQTMDLRGHAVAATRDCMRRYSEFFDSAQLKLLGLRAVNDNTCLVKPGVMVVDLERWRGLRAMEQFEAWAAQRRGVPRWTAARLLRLPWLLQAERDYARLDEDWSCDGLGREAMGLSESRELRRRGFDHRAMLRLGVHHGRHGQIRPVVAMCGSSAKALHFSGPRKPWLDLDAGVAPALCSVSRSFALAAHSSKRQVHLFCRETPVTFVSCVELWSFHISEEDACALRDFEREWREEEAAMAASLRGPGGGATTTREERSEEGRAPKAALEETVPRAGREAGPVFAPDQGPPRQSSTERSTSGPSSKEQGRKEQSPTEQSPTEQSPTEQSPTEQSSTEQNPSKQSSEIELSEETSEASVVAAKKPPTKPKWKARSATWADVETRLNHLSTANLKRSFTILGVPIPSGGRQQLIAKLIEFLAKKDKEKKKQRVKIQDRD